MTQTSQSIHLQYYGLHPAKPVSELRVGDIAVWNTGATSEVIAIAEASKQFLNVTTRYATGRGREMAEHTRRMKKDRLIACKGLTYVAPRDPFLDGITNR